MPVGSNPACASFWTPTSCSPPSPFPAANPIKSFSACADTLGATRAETKDASDFFLDFDIAVPDDAKQALPQNIVAGEKFRQENPQHVFE